MLVVVAQLLASITPHKPELAVNHLAPLFLFTHSPDGPASTAQLSGASTSTIAAAMGNMVCLIAS